MTGTAEVGEIFLFSKESKTDENNIYERYVSVLNIPKEPRSSISYFDLEMQYFIYVLNPNYAAAAIMLFTFYKKKNFIFYKLLLNSFKYSLGVFSYCFLKQVLKYFGSEKPTIKTISVIEYFPDLIKFAAFFILIVRINSEVD